MAPLNAYQLHQGIWTGTPAPPAPPVVVPPPPVPPPVDPTPPTPSGYAKPNGSNTGISPAGLKGQAGDETLGQSGVKFDGYDFKGRQLIAAGVTDIAFTRCIFRGLGGRSSSTGLADCTQPGIKRITFTDCTFIPDTPSVWWDAVLGHDYSVLRCNAYGTVDGFGVYNTSQTSDTAMVNVSIVSSYIHDLVYMSPDAEQKDGHTHNDGVQIQGGGGITILGNTIECLAGPLSNTRSPYYPACTGQAIAVTANVSQIHDVTVDQNWLDGGAQAVTYSNQGHGVGAGMKVTKNRFGRNSKLHPLKFFPGVTVTTAGNVYDDDGSPIPIFVGS